MSNLENLSGKTVIVTGAGSGIGRSVAREFAGRGAYVVAVGRNPQQLEETVRSCTRPGNIVLRSADVGDPQAVEDVIQSAVRERGGIDFLLNNAAVYPRAALVDMTSEEWVRAVNTNLNGTALVCRAAIRALAPHARSVILNLGSSAFLGPLPDSTAYCATKAGVAAFTLALAVELRARGSAIIVNEWRPENYRTRMSPDSGLDPALAGQSALQVWAKSLDGAGGRIFAGRDEWVPHVSRVRRIKTAMRRLIGRSQ